MNGIRSISTLNRNRGRSRILNQKLDFCIQGFLWYFLLPRCISSLFLSLPSFWRDFKSYNALASFSFFTGALSVVVHVAHCTNPGGAMPTDCCINRLAAIRSAQPVQMHSRLPSALFTLGLGEWLPPCQPAGVA